MQRPGKIKDVKEKIHARPRELLQHGVGNFVWASVVKEERLTLGWNYKKFSKSKWKAESLMRFFRVGGPEQLRHVDFG